MRYYTKYITIIAALLLSITTLAKGEFAYTYKLNGNNSTQTAAGTIVGSISENIATLTLTPTNGNYITTEKITVVKTLSGTHAQARTRVEIDDIVIISATNPDADPSAATTYTFEVDDENYDYEVTADFQSRISISGAEITQEETSYTYDGKEHKPAIVSVKLSGKDLTANTDYSISYNEDCTNVGEKEVTITGVRTYSGTATTTFTITAATMTVTANGYEGTYDEKAHGITVTAPEGATVKYGTQKGTYNLTESPTYTDAGTYMVHYQVTMNNYTTVADSATVEISKAGITPTVTLEGWTYGATANEPSVTGNTGNGEVTYTYMAEGAEAFTSDVPTAVGTHTIKATIVETTNYNGAEATNTFTITAASMTVTAEGYSGTYDGEGHGITVTAPEGAKVMHGTKKGTYDLETSPTYTDAGTYKVHYQVTMNNYTTVADSATVEISKAGITPTVTLEGWTYGATANEPSVTGNTGNGEVTYTYMAEGAEAFTSDVPTAVGTHTIKATIAETTNYNSAEAMATFTITAASMTVTAEGYSGTYDGKDHGITVTAPEGAKVMYGTKKDIYELETSPTYTDAGTYKVYYQVTQDNYDVIADSATVSIAKAAGGLSYSATTASAELNGDGWTAPELSNPNSLTVTYTSSNTAVATISEAGAVTLAGIGETTIKAASAGDTNHEASEAQYVLTVSRGKAKGYGVWIGETEADEDNKDDILGDEGAGEEGKERATPSFIFNPDENTLLVIGSNEGLTIESRRPELKIHLSNDNRLKKIFYNNQGNSENTGTLLFTCDSNFPGTVTIGNTAGESAITGFSSVSYEFSLQPLKPEKAKYTGGQMTDSLGIVADTLTVGPPLQPLTGDENETLNPDDFTTANPDGSTATVDLTSANVNNIFYTLPEGTDGQGYDPETNTISVVDPMTDEDVEKIATATINNTTTVGSSDYAENFIGLTFIVQGGEGVIKIDQEAEEGYEFHLKIGDNPSVKLNSGQEEIAYELTDATYCWLYLVKKAAAARRWDGTRVGKRDRAPGSIRSVKVKAKSVSSSKSATKASGGLISQETNQTITGIVEIKNETTGSRHDIETTSNKWYTIDGRQINKPTQKGLYIRNRKKYVVK